jgi:hypothetical protein
MVQHILPKRFQRIHYYGLHGNVRYRKSRVYLEDIIPADMPTDPRGYRVLPAKHFAQRFFDCFAKDPLLCPQMQRRYALGFDLSSPIRYH